MGKFAAPSNPVGCFMAPLREKEYTFVTTNARPGGLETGDVSRDATPGDKVLLGKSIILTLKIIG